MRQVYPGGAAVEAQVHVAGGGAVGLEVGVEGERRRGLRAQVDDRRDQLGVLAVADAEEVAVHDREAAAAAGEVAARAGIVERPAADGVGAVGDRPAGRGRRRVEGLERAVVRQGVTGGVARSRIDGHCDVLGDRARADRDLLDSGLIAGVRGRHVQRVRRVDRQLKAVGAGLRVRVDRAAGRPVHRDRGVQRPALTRTVRHDAADGYPRHRGEGEVLGDRLLVDDGHRGNRRSRVPVVAGGDGVRARRHRDRVRTVGTRDRGARGGGGVADLDLHAGEFRSRRRVGHRALHQAVRSGRERYGAVGCAEAGGAVVAGLRVAQVRRAARAVGT